ncbi:MAG: dephospho-CoA kinase [Oscillospiraceae bacterium]|jgi:dephospho-CoA kinase|nr:dephospho-CoA kinase [Oscillospiraceae bacterium]
MTMTDFGDLNIIGLTGTSGAGKTAASRVFAERGFIAVDCDRTARRVISGSKCAEEVRRVFPELYDGENVFDRKKAALTLFSSPEKLSLYEKTVFPYVIYGIIRVIVEYSKKGARDFLLDAPTLYQSGADDFCKVVIAVVSDRDTAIRRIVERDKIDAASAALRLGAQRDAGFFKERAGYVVENNGDLEQFTEKINEMINGLKNGGNKKREKTG